jgi:hypothetical protein
MIFQKLPIVAKRSLANWSSGLQSITCGLLSLGLFPTSAQARSETVTTDICIYGATAGGVAAAVQTARMDKTVSLAEFGAHIGGLTSGGLGATDIGNKAAIGGIAREFYERVARYYAREEAWKHEKPHDYFARQSGRNTLEDLQKPGGSMWTFEPHVAEQVFRELLAEANVQVRFGQRLDSIKQKGGKITEIRMEDGTLYRAKMFIDASYEGDLMPKAGVSYTVGREPNGRYGETLNGVRAQTPHHQFKVPVDPYLKPGDPSSGLLPFVQSGEGGKPGEGDRCVQAYNFRLCYTTYPDNRLPHPRPENYAPSQYELLARYLEALVVAGKKPELASSGIPFGCRI